MPARRLALATLPALALLAAAALPGCAASTAPDSAEATGGVLSIYSSLPLHGPDGPIAEQLVDGEKLALAQAGARAGRFKIGYVSLDDANPAKGRWDPGITAGNAKRAAQDPSTIAYLGEFNSGATAVSLPLTNGAGVLQLSAASPYVGLTSSLDAGQDEPERFYPSGRRTFGRLAPGDPSEAQALLALMRSLGVHKAFVLDDQNPFAEPLAAIVAGALPAAGIELAGRESIATTPGSANEKLVERISTSGADAVLLVGEAAASAEESAAAAALWRALHRADPRMRLLASSGMLKAPFVSSLGSADASTYLTSPTLSSASYPPLARRVLADYRRRFGTEGGTWALYGYATMRLVLDAIAAAGSHATDRRQVIAHLFDAPVRASVLGPLAIRSDGESTLSHYGVDTVRNGAAVFLHPIALGALARASG